MAIIELQKEIKDLYPFLLNKVLIDRYISCTGLSII